MPAERAAVPPADPTLVAQIAAQLLTSHGNYLLTGSGARDADLIANAVAVARQIIAAAEAAA